MEIIQTQFAAKSTMIRQAVLEHMPWIESVLKTPASELMQLRLDESLTEYLSWNLLKQAAVPLPAHASKCYPLPVMRTEMPPRFMPAIYLRTVTLGQEISGMKAHSWMPEWLDCPVALHIEGLPRPVIVLHIPYVEGGESTTGWRQVLVLAIQDAAGFLNKIQATLDNSSVPAVDVVGIGRCGVYPTQWDDLILDANTCKLLREDYECFFKREEWFRAHRLPYRRGYLLHGPPGNGKSSAIRAMLSRLGIHGHTVNLFQRDLEDNDLMTMFHRAAEQTPALIVLEDLDRCFLQANNEDYHPRINIQTLLNCLDGITTQDGVVVVATANDPTLLDPAILRRPGRFDRVVEFMNPTTELRVRYLKHLSQNISEDDIARCAHASEGFSFAQLRESYILAGQTAFAEDREIGAQDILHALDLLQTSVNIADKKRTRKSGFKMGNHAAV